MQSPQLYNEEELESNCYVTKYSTHHEKTIARNPKFGKQ